MIKSQEAVRSRSEWHHTKTEARAEHGMVATRHPLAAEVGCELLEVGGNAVDAAVGASFAASVVQPVANTIGGGGLLVVHRPGYPESASIDYRYESAAAATSSMFDPADGTSASIFTATATADAANEVGHLAVAVPGSVAGLLLAHERWGSLGLDTVIAPAVALARDGFVMDWYGALMAAGHLDLLRRFPRTAQAFLREGRYPYRPRILEDGDLVRQPALASTLAQLAVAGAASFYEGAFANEVADEMRAGGGIITADDLRAYRPREEDAIQLTYRGHGVIGAANAAMYRLLIPLLDELNLEGLASTDPARLHLIIEALRFCRADQAAAFGDESRIDRDVWGPVVSGERARDLAGAIDPTRRTDIDTTDGVAARARSEQTMHLSVVDRDRMAVSLTETILGNWGSGVTTASGVLLNNGMSGFGLTEGHPNCVGPRRRPLSNMTPLLILRQDGSLAASIGASGGPRIVGAVAQVLMHMLDCRMGIQEAIEHPRVDVAGDVVLVDARFGKDVASALEAYGHTVELRTEDLSTFEFGNPCGVAIADDGSLRGGASPYQTTIAIGYSA